jgi:hypothetical protein
MLLTKDLLKNPIIFSNKNNYGKNINVKVKGVNNVTNQNIVLEKILRR